MNETTPSTPNRRTRRMWWIIFGIIAVVVVVLAIRSASAKRPGDLGVVQGELRKCPESPNCVCSFDDDPQHGIEPLPLTVPAAEAMEQLKAALEKLPRTKIITAQETYLHAESASALFHFVDDVEIYIDAEAKLIHLRSASRVGHSDLGVNRHRMNEVRETYLNQLNK